MCLFSSQLLLGYRKSGLGPVQYGTNVLHCLFYVLFVQGGLITCQDYSQLIPVERRKEGNACLISEPQLVIKKYSLRYYSIIYATILVVAVGTVLISTCYLIYKLCRRKRVRGQAAASRVEKKSCLLIVCVMTVFFFTEVPRLYISLTLFSSYQSNLDMQNVALQILTTELNQIYSACLDDSLSCISRESSDFIELSLHDKRIRVYQLLNVIF